MTHLCASGLAYTIFRQEGLKAKPPTSALVVSKEDTLNSGKVSVADVAVLAPSEASVKNRVLEIVESETEGCRPVKMIMNM